ncbi:hypothetical protein [Archangium sp.]|uniref:hypothetical protein n=1 Tax=Archangium sp. TaxID=1872627 RepID=UPI00286A140A|nr:hypothetical protein [Archangium sp.]
MPKIVISYRRDDSGGQAGRLFAHLTKHFGSDSVFMDVDLYNVTRVEDIYAQLRQGRPVIAVVKFGPQWQEGDAPALRADVRVERWARDAMS